MFRLGRLVRKVVPFFDDEETHPEEEEEKEAEKLDPGEDSADMLIRLFLFSVVQYGKWAVGRFRKTH